MSKEVYLTKQQNGSFIPAMESDKEITDKLAKGQTFRFKVSKQRNYKFLQKFFVLIRIVFENQDVYKNVDHFRNDLTIECGFYDIRVNKFTGAYQMEAKSISFAKMNEIDFNQYFNSFVDKVCELYGYDREVFIEEINLKTEKR
jgi:hypothetical protein